ncbi:hypothetical protein NC653_024386 [Populus alba x Populus x berolinensis]|uniref:Uncharacterized protein n=1 Tax=Populus alba x Populus x berolinensis TaxID=444605 RepID=A0AAD6M9L6_9ROSI|nr:hypothetical protein NC653_024386 [Populus alba x Populus x berolinensis]
MRVDKVESTTVIQIQSFAESSTESICTEQAAVADTNSKCYSPSPYSPSTIDSQVSGSNISIYAQNLLRIHLANFALMNPTPMGGAYSASGNTSEKKLVTPHLTSKILSVLGSTGPHGFVLAEALTDLLLQQRAYALTAQHASY